MKKYNTLLSRKHVVSFNNETANFDPPGDDTALKTFVLHCIRVDDFIDKRLTIIDLKYGSVGPMI